MTPSHQLPPQTSQALFTLLTRSLLARAVCVAAELGIADHLANGVQDAEQLAAATGADPGALSRLLRALAGLGIVRTTTTGFDITELGSALRSINGSAREAALFFGTDMMWAAWGALGDAVRDGRPAFHHAHGQEVFAYLAEHPDDLHAFQGWMSAQSRLQSAAILEAYDFSGLSKLVDVGGGTGTLLAAILAAHPGATGILFDRAEVVARPDPTLMSLSGRFVTADGDFFAAVPPDGDCYLLKLVIHDWDDDRSVKILSNIRRAMRPHGRVLLLETVIPEDDSYHHSKFLDINMLVFADGGRERTEAEYRSLCREAGLHVIRLLTTTSPLSILELAPRER